MAIHLTKKISEAIKKIVSLEFPGLEYHEFVVSESEEPRTYLNSDELIERYGQFKWHIVDLINEKYGSSFDLHNWIDKISSDEVAYFLNEAGSNCLNYSQFKIPRGFHLWLGKNGFIIALEQKGLGFNAEKVHNLRLKENEGEGFDFYRNCHGKIFFDDNQDAKIIYFKHLFN